MKRLPLLTITSLFLATRLLFFAITYIAYILLTAPKESETPVNTQAFFNSWNHLDASHYLTIAQFGYTKLGDFAFFPLFPLLIRALAYPLGNQDFLLIGTIISNLAFFGVLCVAYLVAMGMIEKNEEQVARRTLLYLSIFPTAFFFFAAYNESLFLLFTLSAFLALRYQRWWLAGLLGMLSAFTSFLGIVLLVPFAYELWKNRTTAFSDTWRAIVATTPILLVPLAIVLYALYCWYETGNPFIFAAVQSHASNPFSWLQAGIAQALLALISQSFGSLNEAYALLGLSATTGFILLIVLGWRTLPRAYSYWMVFFLFCILLEPVVGISNTLFSSQRLLLEMVPAFITLALLGLKYPRLHHSIMVLFPISLAILSIAFIMNRWPA
jgi:Gpi18-like mannosyltransferase